MAWVLSAAFIVAFGGASRPAGASPSAGVEVAVGDLPGQPGTGTCPSSVDTADEGWICSLLILDTPAESPGDGDIAEWADRLARSGRRSVAEGIVFSDAAVDGDIAALYRSQLGREPDAEGLLYWRHEVQRLGNEMVAEFGVFNSGEYRSKFDSVDAFVGSQYRYHLGRRAGPDERSYWAGLVADGVVAEDGVVYALAVSREAGEVRARTMYRDYVRRSPDSAGLAHWGAVAAARGLLAASVEFASSAEAVAALGMNGLILAGNEGPPTTAEACLAQLPVDLLIDRIPFVLVAEGSDLREVVDHVGGVGLLGSYDTGGLQSVRSQLDGADFPPLLASDEEGGRVQRLAPVLGPLPAAADISQMPVTEARTIYRTYAQKLSDVGVDAVFAPVLATGRRAVGDRSYGDDPDVVTERAGLYVDALQQAGVLPVLKHFPGLGDATANTDQRIATGPDLQQLRNHDLIPYRRLIPDRPVAVMMSHLLVPDLTGGAPASLSPAAYHLLRDDYGFGGLVITDSLSARAITTTWTVPEAAAQAVAAGADAVLFGDRSQVPAVHAALRRAADSGAIAGIRLQRAAGAVLRTQGVDPCDLLGS